MNNAELYLKTAFCCMACDGEIAEEEVALLKDFAKKENLFGGLDVQEAINEHVASINKEGKAFLDQYLCEVKNAELDESEALNLVRIAIETIEVDNEIKYSEVSFFKRIRKYLSISDEAILKEMPDKEDYLLPDIESEDSFDWVFAFDSIQLADIKS